MTKIFCILTFLLFAGCSGNEPVETKLPLREHTNDDSNHFEGSLLQGLLNGGISIDNSDLKYSKKISVDSLNFALKKAQHLLTDFTFDDIKLDFGNYYRIDAAEEREQHVKKLNPKFISLTSDLKDYNEWYFGDHGLTLISGYFLARDKIILTMSKVGHECDSGIQRYWLVAINSDGTISEPTIIHDEHGDWGYYLKDFKMLNDSSILLTQVYDVESNILPETKTDTTVTDILTLNISKFPFDTISYKSSFITRQK